MFEPCLVQINHNLLQPSAILYNILQDVCILSIQLRLSCIPCMCKLPEQKCYNLGPSIRSLPRTLPSLCLYTQDPSTRSFQGNKSEDGIVYKIGIVESFNENNIARACYARITSDMVTATNYQRKLYFLFIHASIFMFLTGIISLNYYSSLIVELTIC